MFAMLESMGQCLGVDVSDDRGLREYFQGLRWVRVRLSTGRGELSLVVRESGEWRLGEQLDVELDFQEVARGRLPACEPHDYRRTKAWH